MNSVIDTAYVDESLVNVQHLEVYNMSHIPSHSELLLHVEGPSTTGQFSAGFQPLEAWLNGALQSNPGTANAGVCLSKQCLISSLESGGVNQVLDVNLEKLK